MNPNVLKNKLLLANDNYGYTAWHRASVTGSLGASETLWNCVKEAKLHTAELLLATNG